MFCISESEADPVVGWMFTAVKNDLCGILLRTRVPAHL